MDEYLVYRALDRRVLTVAVINEKVGDWSAYIGPVEGKSHDAEKYDVAETGNKLPYEIAKLIYGDIAARFKWRY